MGVAVPAGQKAGRSAVTERKGSPTMQSAERPGEGRGKCLGRSVGRSCGGASSGKRARGNRATPYGPGGFHPGPSSSVRRRVSMRLRSPESRSDVGRSGGGGSGSDVRCSAFPKRIRRRTSVITSRRSQARRCKRSRLPRPICRSRTAEVKRENRPAKDSTRISAAACFVAGVGSNPFSASSRRAASKRGNRASRGDPPG
jgi:hypothetical protein